ncbi:ORF6N domain-containing protein [Acinetobacter baumannii]|uniref:ORF6N domain-containing protein n=1 Tax=Acinetobacter baumannii TaxID=470 RepID=UPI001F212E43|nr:ORF6N domain-containing protein [Acinetobacter baumannii]MCF1333094.1 ORF6N domain-containing protein [Acinetobacter baumannii]MDC4847578.1 ORF6N domain-containing protein [Acinetobacter baumannii]MDC5342008.1 ORF6N domain-containing protein [Acinetobacter baumannii]MDC5471276.1 ORF6N domain-containing protein [Acinetobacter baumannii]MDH2654686.1 ORF6N domain-containing protein [Acinetobacter baumannii]
MNTIANINDKEISIINYKAIPIVTTEMLADFYGTDIDNIRQNFSRNAERFVEGKHFYKLEGSELKAFKNSVTNCHAVKKNARIVNLWTERGAARHAKMLDTDQAWEVFEQLEDCYFHRKDILSKTHKSEREPLTSAVNMLVSKTKHLNYSEAYKLVHQRFNVQSIDEIPYDVIPVAVEYVHHLIALYSQADKKQQYESKHVDSIARHMLWLNHWWSEFGESIRKLGPSMGHGIHDHFKFGAEDAKQLVGREVYMPIFELAKTHDWHKGGIGYTTLLECSLIKS